MKDHRRLRAFVLADQLALKIYAITTQFPADERFALSSQLRRAAVSAASNIVEGCARHSPKDLLHFLDVSLGSVREVGYQLSLAHRLGYFDSEAYEEVDDVCQETARTLAGLIKSRRRQ